MPIYSNNTFLDNHGDNVDCLIICSAMCAFFFLFICVYLWFCVNEFLRMNNYHKLPVNNCDSINNC